MTSLFVLTDPVTSAKTVVVANIGDSRCVLINAVDRIDSSALAVPEAEESVGGSSGGTTVSSCSSDFGDSNGTGSGLQMQTCRSDRGYHRGRRGAGSSASSSGSVSTGSSPGAAVPHGRLGAGLHGPAAQAIEQAVPVLVPLSAPKGTTFTQVAAMSDDHNLYNVRETCRIAKHISLEPMVLPWDLKYQGKARPVLCHLLLCVCVLGAFFWRCSVAFVASASALSALSPRPCACPELTCYCVQVW